MKLQLSRDGRLSGTTGCGRDQGPYPGTCGRAYGPAMDKTLLAKITTALRQDRHAKLVTAGRVSCRLVDSGDIDVDRCFSCPYFEGTVGGKAGKEWLRCRPSAS